MKNLLRSTLQPAALCIVISSSLRAGEPAPLSTPVTVAPPSGDSWEFSVAPYGWLAGLDGTVGIGPAVANVDLSFSDILENLDVGAMLAVEARKGPWGIQLDSLWLKLSSTATTPRQAFGAATVEVEQLRLAPAISYRVMEGDTDLDLLAGAQYMSIDTDLSLSRGALPAITGSSEQDWVDPMVGIRINHKLSERWSILARGEIGGFGAEADLVWQALGAIGYQCCPGGTILFGYRHLDIDYQNGGFVYDTATSGFILGLNFEL